MTDPLTQPGSKFPIGMVLFWPPLLMFYGVIVGAALPKMTLGDVPLTLSMLLIAAFCFGMDLLCYRAALSEQRGA